MRSNSSLNELLEHLEGSIWLIRRNHMPSSIDHIVHKSIVFGHPSLKTSSGVGNWHCSCSLLPSNALNVLLSLNIWNLGINISSKEQDLQSSLLEAFKKLESTQLLLVGLSNIIIAWLPKHLGDMKLLLYSGIIEKFRNTIFIRTASWLCFYSVIKFLIICTIPECPSWLPISVVFSSIADANTIIGVNSSSCLDNAFYTSSASLFPVKQEGLVSSAEVYLQVLMRFLISGP